MAIKETNERGVSRPPDKKYTDRPVIEEWLQTGPLAENIPETDRVLDGVTLSLVVDSAKPNS